MEYGDEGYLIHLGLERREARMTRAQIDRVVEQLLADVDFVATVRNHVATVDAYIASLRPDVPEDLGKRPSVDHLHRIQKEIMVVSRKLWKFSGVALRAFEGLFFQAARSRGIGSIG
jgi:hypothetical protein